MQQFYLLLVRLESGLLQLCNKYFCKWNYILFIAEKKNISETDNNLTDCNVVATLLKLLDGIVAISTLTDDLNQNS